MCLNMGFVLHSEHLKTNEQQQQKKNKENRPDVVAVLVFEGSATVIVISGYHILDTICQHFLNPI